MKKLLTLTICLLILLLNINKTIAEEKTDSSYAGEEVVLNKKGYWKDDEKGEAEVELVVTGLEHVGELVTPVDIVFLVDNSRSMPDDCNNPNHITYASYKINDPRHKWNSELFFTEVIPLIEKEIDDPQGKINVKADGSWSVDSQLQIPLSIDGWILYPGFLSSTSKSKFNALNSDIETAWYIADLNTPVISWEYYSYHGNQNNNNLERIFDKRNNPTLQVTFTTLEPSYPYTLYTTGNCLSNLQANYEAISSFVNELYVKSPESHISISTFTGYARKNDSTIYTDFAQKEDQSELLRLYKIAIDDILYKNTLAYTNYEAGFRSVLQTLKDDKYINGSDHSSCDNNQIVVFFTDGWPNSYCDNGNMTTQVNASFPLPYEKAKPVIAEIKDRGVEIYVATAGINTTEGDLSDIENMLNEIVSSPNYRYQVENYGKTIFEKMYQDIFDNICGGKSIIIEDLIDSRYFKIDKEKLLENKNNYFYPKDVSVELEDVIVDDVACEKTKFHVNVADSHKKTVTTRIPLDIKEEILEEEINDALPLNYDPINTLGGASVYYLDENNSQQIVRTKRVFIQFNNSNLDNNDNDLVIPENKPNKYPNTGDNINTSYPIYLMIVVVPVMILSTKCKTKKVK